MDYTIDVPIYNSHVLFLLETTPEELDEVFERNKNKMTEETYKQCMADIKNDEDCYGFVSSEGVDYIVYLREPSHYNYVIHELFHLTNNILYDRGITYSREAEAWAYLLGWLTDEFHKILDDFNKSKEVPKKTKNKQLKKR